jgi:hypothetical protein
MLATILMATPGWADDLAPYTGEIEFRGDWSDGRPYQTNLTLRGRGENLRMVTLTRDLSPGISYARPSTTNYRLNQTIVGQKYRTRNSGDIFGGGGSTSCHYVITRMTLTAGILETRDYHVIETVRGGCPADRDVIARFRPIETRGLSFRSGQLSARRQFRIVDGRVTRVAPAPVETASVPVQSNDDDRATVIDKPAEGGGSSAVDSTAIGQ